MLGVVGHYDVLVVTQPVNKHLSLAEKERRRSRGGRGRRHRRSQPASQPASLAEVLHLRAGLHRLAGRFDSFAEELEEQSRLQQRAERFGVSLGSR